MISETTISFCGGCLGCIVKSTTRAKGDMGLQRQRQGCCLCFVQCYSF
ncbi:hypothetical protein BDA96_09G272100 [Sorghum bicolor]|uniref:Uncharacterized protein n=1 Tax=Sorghum bicolor TaxID=4558 RepID=A0A921U5H3_SORBI|nr:hypothetical protein BDA96_09G272100 [Sorghum bicolor]